jgi:cytoskeletal protein CcmA (bactofilin family)
MALFGKDKMSDAIPPAAPRPEPIAPREREVVMGERDRGTSQFGGVGGIDAFLGKGTKVTGKLVLDGPGRIEGNVEGEISAQDTLTIGEGASVSAKVTGATIIVEGKITGDVNARQRLEVRASGKVHGNVSTPSLVVHEGAILDGQVAMGTSTGASKAKHDEPETAATKHLERARDSALQVASALTR